jgi:DNA-binding MarR family transcriptional regulator
MIPIVTAPVPAPGPERASASAETLAVANRLRPVLLHINRHLRREAQTQGTSAGQISLLASIEQHAGIGVADLAAREGLSAPSVSNSIDRLEAGGYVTRVRESTGDRRRVGLAATRKGSALLRRVRSRRTAWLAARLQTLDAEQRGRIAEAVDALSALVSQR